MPPCLLIDEQNTIRHIFGDCNNYLSFSAGKGVMLAQRARVHSR